MKHLLAAVFFTWLAHPAAAQEIGDSVVGATEKQLGRGFDLIAGVDRADCMIWRPEDATIIEEPEPRAELAVTSVETKSELATELDLGVGGSYFAGLVSVEGRFGFYRSQKIVATTSYLFVRASITASREILRDAKIKPEFLDLLPGSGGPSEFRSRCGDRYLGSLVKGGLFYGLVEVVSESVEESREVTAQLKSAFASGSVDADFSEKLKSIVGSRSVSAKVLREGGAGPETIDPAEIVDRALAFAAEVKDNPFTYAGQFRQYEDSENWPTGVKPVAIGDAGRALDRLAVDHQLLSGFTAEIERQLLRPVEMDRDLIKEDLRRTEESVILLKEAAGRCREILSQCVYPAEGIARAVAMMVEIEGHFAPELLLPKYAPYFQIIGWGAGRADTYCLAISQQGTRGRFLIKTEKCEFGARKEGERAYRHWVIVGDGTIRDKRDGSCLSADEAKVGAEVVAVPCTGALTQRWEWAELLNCGGSGYSKCSAMRLAGAPSLCLALPTTKRENAQAKVDNCVGRWPKVRKFEHQRWRLMGPMERVE